MPLLRRLLFLVAAIACILSNAAVDTIARFVGVSCITASFFCCKEQEAAQQRHSSTLFYVAVALGLLFIIIGFLLPLGSVHEWVGLGLIIGGVIGMFIGTVSYWSDLTRWMRPVVIAIELIILLVIVYKRMNVGMMMDNRRSDDAPAKVAKRKRR